MKAVIDGDLVVGRGTYVDGPAIPVFLQDTPLAQLRFDGEQIVDASLISLFYIDNNGTKHISSQPGYQELACGYAEDLIYEGSLWRVKNASDDLYRAQAAALARLALEADLFAAQLTGPVSQAEKDSWPSKEAAARAVLAGTETENDTVMLQAEADLTSETLPDLAGFIVSSADIYRTAAAKIAGIRRMAVQSIDSATSQAEITAAVTVAHTQMAQLV